MNTMEQTLGKKRVDLKENEPDKVKSLKIHFAGVIDYLESMRNRGTQAEKGSSEKHRLISIAQTKVEEACMFSIRAITRDEE